MDLKKYLHLHNISVDDFAKRLEVSPAMVYQGMSKMKRFGDDTKLKIVRETNGEVGLADLTLADDEINRREVSNA